jgi:hypothetical protein
MECMGLWRNDEVDDMDSQKDKFEFTSQLLYFLPFHSLAKNERISTCEPRLRRWYSIFNQIIYLPSEALVANANNKSASADIGRAPEAAAFLHLFIYSVWNEL